MISSLKNADTIPECPLRISIDVHFNNTVTDGFPDFGMCGTGTSVEYKINRMCVRYTQFFFDIILRIFQNDWHQLHVSWFVNPMNVSKRSCDGEVRRNFA